MSERRVIRTPGPTPSEVLAEPRYQLMPNTNEFWGLDGLWWYQAPPPPADHEHFAQSIGWVGLELARRCACGAFRSSTIGRHGWYQPDEPRVAPKTSFLRRLFRRV